MTATVGRIPYSKEQHAHQTDGYGRYIDVPFATLEHQLHDAALGDCAGITVLDLGGGQGLRARQVIDHGASAVDVVDCEITLTKSWLSLLCD
jgi:hypothetical protein